jgi:branched-chain amino acid transport system permease protein
MSSWYSGNELLIQGALVNVLLAFSIQVPLRSGVFTFMSVAFYISSSYSTGILALHGFAIWTCLLFSVLGTVVLGYVLSFLTRRVSGVFLGMSSIACVLILGVVATNGGSLTGGSLGLVGVPKTTSTIEILLIVLIVVVGLSRLERSSTGRASTAVGLDKELALSNGINVRRHVQLVFTLSCVLGSIAGGLYILTYTAIAPSTAGLSLVLTAVSMAVVGGMRSWAGAALGALILTALPYLLSDIGLYENAAYGALLVLAVMFAPEGLIGILGGLGPGIRRLLGGSHFGSGKNEPNEARKGYAGVR